ncbi:GPW/gp25 family protein [Paraburkholderia sp. UCT31]|uniref:GPW/gp25 family protein n=1 Tax=Paraburkholderia sp. UCT31 TaxID=2615209 RepID=UPI00165550FE|nr:GPW/gp25 family protein [Paraburkholderia sp. UCT31]MBC8737664.1 GPW/gp25 family protein [Paraburkholderia sp. UCT31]
MNIAYPFRYDPLGRTAQALDADHVRDLIEQMLFTNPGERVNLPDLGSGLQQMVFAPNSAELAAALQFTVQASLQRWLGDLIDIRSLVVTATEASLTVNVQYMIRGTTQTTNAQFVRAI